MYPPLPSFRPVVSLMPNSGLQFLDFAFDIDRTPKLTRSFWEDQQVAEKTEDGRVPVALRCLRPHPTTGELYDPVSDRAPDPEETYTLNKARGLEVFLEKWVPVPILRIKAERAPGDYVFDRGPSNWARVRVVELADRDRDGNSHRVVLCFDTEIRDLDPERPYLGPSPQDAEEESRFKLVTDDGENAWFLNEPWIDEWLDEILREFRAAQRPGRPLRDEDFPHACEHWARYLTFLQMLGDACGFPVFKLIDTVSQEPNFRPIDVDLVLDIGNSRTCGILIESNPDDRLELNDSYVLDLRDLSRPERVYAQPFDSRIEFVQARFGRDSISRRSGRGKAFYWPSITRVGPEAERLAGEALGVDGITGLSSPKRYLWDRRPLNQVWRFNGVEADGLATEPPVSGAIMAHVTEEGEVLRQRRGKGTSAVRAKFSRSSLFTFMMTEILLQALVMINAPGTRGRRKHSDVPRQLRRVIMTMPPATPIAEQRIMRERADSAIKLTWDALGWSQSQYRTAPEPRVILSWDEASCTQLVYLYTEVTQKFQGAVGEFFSIYGKPRPMPEPATGKPGRNRAAEPAPERADAAAPSLRIASIDIGGGTTDLMVITYDVEGDRAITPRQEFREGFKIAGDDILHAVVERHVLPPIERHLARCGAADAKALMKKLFAGDRGGMSEQERHQRRLFVHQVTVPVGLAMLHAYEAMRPFDEDPPFVRPYRDFFNAETTPSARIVEYVERAAGDNGAESFSLDDVGFEIDLAAVGDTVQAVVGEILADLCEAIHALDCDLLLLSGRPSRLPAVQEAVLAHLPVPADRMVPMHQYRVGNWYPFRDASARIDDPKTTAAVGGMLCALAEGQIEGFLLRASSLRLRSTARFIGEMEISGQIKQDRVLFSEIDLEADAAGASAASSLTFYAPMFIGFRQLPIERWPATPLYHLELANPATAQRMRLPLTVTLERAERMDDDDDASEDFTVAEIEDSEGTALRTSDIVLRLQTLKSQAGYWLDTGILAVH